MFACGELDCADFCFFPQIKALYQLHSAYPNSTFILNLRDSMKWATSVGNFHENMHQRLTMCGVTNGSSDFDLINAYNRHTELVRDFARRTGHRLVEIDIESRSAGEVLAHEFGKPANCWKQANARLEKEAPTICYVGDSLVRMLYCAEFNVSECNFKDDHPPDRWSFKPRQRGEAASSMTFDELRGRFFWRPTLKRLKSKFALTLS